MTPTEIQNNIDKINAALGLLYEGKRLTKLTYVDDGTERGYEYQKLNISDLTQELERLNLLLATKTPIPIIYSGANTVELIITKRR